MWKKDSCNICHQNNVIKLRFSSSRGLQKFPSGFSVIPLFRLDMCSLKDAEIELFMLHFISGFNRAWFYKGQRIWDWPGITDCQSCKSIRLLWRFFWSSVHTGDSFIFCWNFLKSQMSITEMSDLCYKRKSRLSCLLVHTCSLCGRKGCLDIFPTNNVKKQLSLYSRSLQHFFLILPVL